MPLPQPDPSNPALPAPLFADVDAVRGDHLRANNQLVWENLQYLFDFTGRTTDTLTEGATHLYYTDARAKAAALTAALTGFVSGSDAAIAATDTILQAFAKTQGQVTAAKAAITALQALTPKYAKLTDTKAANTAAGGATTGSFITRTLNTKDNDASSIVSLSSNQFTLQAGTYRILATAPGYRVSRHKAILYNVTDSSTTIIGTSEETSAIEDQQTRSWVQGEFSIASAKAFEIRQQFQGGQATNGLGIESNFGVSEVYTVVELWKVA